ncbi:hypothetical protein AX16_002393 [Volvariella volvacea WC 439]|nr:hypothetical protein AX16_002393 [Volvariella volvacea WC 439]
MSSAPARLIFILVLVIQCILWSHSRYTYTARSPASYHADRSLVKRISLELLTPNATALSSGAPEKECRPIIFPAPDQCRHIEDSCPVSETFLSINYLQHYFCADNSVRPFIFGSLVVWLIFLFSTLGISASDFFTPNLATIAQLLGLDENVAGVTFLAFGNGSPDVFSTFSAMRADSGSLAIGELLGAASFIVSCVVGSMCIIKPFRVNRGPFLRDVGFFTAAVSLLLVILWDGQIRAIEAGLMVTVYVFYVVVVVVGSWWERRRERLKLHEDLMRSEYQDEPHLVVTEPYRDEISPLSPTSLTVPQPFPSRPRAVSHPGPLRLQTHDLPRRPHSRTPSPTASPRFSLMPSFSLVGALEFRHVVTSLQQKAQSPGLSLFDTPTPFAGGHYHTHALPRHHTAHTPHLDPNIDPWDAALSGMRLDNRQQNYLLATPAPTDDPGELLFEGSANAPHAHQRGDATPVPSIFRTPASPTASYSNTETTVDMPLTKWGRFVYILRHVYHTLFPTLHHFQNKSILGQLASLVAAPAVMMLTITLPVVLTPYSSSSSAHEKISSADGRLIEFEEEGFERVLTAEDEVQEEMHELSFNKWLTAAQCICGPLFCSTILFSGSDQQVWITVGTVLIGTAAAILVLSFPDSGNHPTAKMARCSMGFFVAIVWIMAIADEVVQLLQTFGFIFGLSDAMIGLTIFAVGNSLADLVANMSVAVFAPIMGFSACFGGPMLNILMGIGLSGSYITGQTGKPYDLHFSTTLFVSTIGLLGLLTATLIFVPLNDYFLTRQWGTLLIASYIVIMTINVIVELHS